MQDNELKNGQTVPPQDEAAQQAPADAPELPDLDLSAELAKRRLRPRKTTTFMSEQSPKQITPAAALLKMLLKPVNSALKNLQNPCCRS